ncbi:hypothetical protein DXG03_008206 [Asterophora parasitica]|uniref:Glycoside hydrolase family 16 protein n=1 Tax=Asterophora parasitica TaxID=117018 RepID=A0A9P7KE72_9AGAR|nr:hypothetical protein DXG03_008206 [Asterophora parasitica]
MRASTAVLTAIATSLLLFTSVTAVTYDLVKDYSGPSFFNDWTFYDHSSTKLAYVDATTNNAIIKVDSTSEVPYNEKRNTVRMSSNARYGVGSVWVADMLHVPCAYPSPLRCSEDILGSDLVHSAPCGPHSGPIPQIGLLEEIDTFEGVNLQTLNRMGLHTLPGCTITNPLQSASSKQLSSDCSHLTNNNQGCLVQDGSPESYGKGFADAGGGVWVTEFAQSGISIWFFARANVPKSLTGDIKALDTATLGTPTGNWPSTNCAIDKFFEPQNLIFDITLCGDFAAAPSIFPQTCSGVCYTDYVMGNGSNYATAYFEVKSVRVYSSDGTKNVIDGGENNGSSPNNTTGGNGNTPGKDNNALAMHCGMGALLSSLLVGGVALLFA